MEVFSTKGLSPHLRREYWNDVICETFTDLVTDFPDEAEFNAELAATSLGNLRYAHVRTARSKVLHTSHHAARTKDNVFLLHLQLAHESLNCQRGREVFLKEGDFTLVDSKSPYSLEFDRPISMGVLRIPYDALRERIATPEDIVGHKFSGDRNVSGLLSQMLRSFWRQDHPAQSDVVSHQLANNLLDLLATCYQGQVSEVISPHSLRNARFLQLKRFIDYNLGDPDISPSKIAGIFRITPRYLHQIFAQFGGGGGTVGQYILNRRLEECARQFTTPARDHQTITEIAFDWGFNSMTHFSRVFKDKYGLSPRAYRNGVRARVN